MPTSFVPRIRKRRILMLFAILVLGATALITTGCTKQDNGQDAVLTATRIANGRITVGIANARTTIGATLIEVRWIDGGKPAESLTVKGCTDLRLPGAAVNTSTVLPKRPEGGTLIVRVFAEGPKCASAYDYEGWSNEVTIPADQAPIVPPVAVAPAVPTAVLFAQALPVGQGGTLIDARESTGAATLTYAWSAGCGGATYGPGSRRTGEVPVGTRWVDQPTGATTCTVTVADAGGQASASLILEGSALQNSWFVFGDPAVIGITSSDRGAVWACVDPAGGTRFSVPVPLVSTGGDPVGSFPRSSLSPVAGLHRVTAAILGSENTGCVDQTTAGARQVITDLYTVDAAGTIAARRGLRSASFIAPSSLRFVSSKTISEGTTTSSGAMKGATTSGSFSWSTPKSAKGVKRPAGAASLAKGAYVMRSIDMVQGPKQGAASPLLGTGMVLLRGDAGTLACGTLAGSFDSSELVLAGGTRSARTLAGSVTGKQVMYVFPPVSSAAKRSGGVTGLLATALGWITGDQPADRAAKPAKKPKPVKVKAVKASGTASLQTAAKATGLPASCRALVQYLPQ